MCIRLVMAPTWLQTEIERLLLDIHGQINEPDGIYAVARSHEMASQLHLLHAR